MGSQSGSGCGHCHESDDGADHGSDGNSGVAGRGAHRGDHAGQFDSSIFASSTFFGVDYAQPPYGAQQIVPFFLGPQGIVNAIRRNAGEDNVVLSSGWGAGQTGTALALLEEHPALDDVKLVILDNNTNRAGGGFWTTYWIFAPLLLTSAAPTPSDLDIPVLDVGYDYNINGNAATYPINLFADANGLVAYLFSYAGQSNVQLPDEASG